MVFCFQNNSDLLGKNGFSDREKLCKFEAAGQDFAKILRSRTIHSKIEVSDYYDLSVG